MIEAMPRPRPLGLHREVTRHGRVAWYYRDDRGPRIRVRGDYGTEAFWANYEAAKRGETPAPGKTKPNTLAWLVKLYMDSGAWLALEAETRKQRGSILNRVVAKSGDIQAAAINKGHIQAGIDRRSYYAAKHFRQTMRGLFQWAVSAQHVEADPTEGVKLPRRPKTEGFAVWPDEWCQKYEARWPIGTKERVWYEVLYCTGLRRSDAVRVGRPHVKNRRGMIRAAKNGETAYFLVSDRLQAALDAGPIGELTWIAGASGKPLTKESFGTYFREACLAAGVPGRAHGIRKTRATIEAESGASGAKLDAMFGWKTGSNTSAIYIRKANREKLAFGN